MDVTNLVESSSRMEAALCAIDNCGVQVIGRCQNCGRASCVSHQARTEAGFFCSLCAAGWREEMRKRDKQLRDNEEAHRQRVAYVLPAFRLAMEQAGNPETESFAVQGWGKAQSSGCALFALSVQSASKDGSSATYRRRTGVK